MLCVVAQIKSNLNANCQRIGLRLIDEMTNYAELACARIVESTKFFSVGACDTTRICKELHVKENFKLHKNEHNKLSARIKCGCCKKATAVFCHKNG